MLDKSFTPHAPVPHGQPGSRWATAWSVARTIPATANDGAACARGLCIRSVLRPEYYQNLPKALLPGDLLGQRP